MVRENHGEELEFSAEVSRTSTVFLDVAVYVSRDPSRFLEARPYGTASLRWKKPVNLHCDSALPRSVFTVVSKSQIVRYLGLSSTKKIFLAWKDCFTQELKEHGWGRHGVDRMAAKAPK